MLNKILSRRQLIPKDFIDRRGWNKSLIELIASKTISFQRELLELRTPSQQSILKYARILEEESALKKEEEINKPMFLVAPYFYFISTNDPWYNISIEISKAAIKLKNDDLLYATICTSKDTLLNRDDFEKIIDDYKDFDGYLVWFSNFRDDSDGKEYLSGLKEFIIKLSEMKKPIYLLYGGYFSLLLSKLSRYLQGYSRNICYGESRDVDAEMPTGGGAPRRYYMTLAHVKLPEMVARTFFSDHPKLLCNCRICSSITKEIKKVIHGEIGAEQIGVFFDMFDFIYAKRHFVTTHAEEIEEISMTPLDTIIKKLKKSYEETQNLKTGLYGIPSSQLERWYGIFEDRGYGG